MKFPAVVLVSLVCAFGLAAQTPASGTTKSTTPRIILPPDKPAATKGADAKAKAAADAKAAKTAVKKEEKPATIEGVEIPRSGQGFLGLRIVESTFKLSFYDEKKKPVPVDMDRAALRWDPKYKVGEDRVILTPSGDGKSLTSPKNIRPPYNFKLFITLIKEAREGQDAVNESYVVDFKQ